MIVWIKSGSLWKKFKADRCRINGHELTECRKCEFFKKTGTGVFRCSKFSVIAVPDKGCPYGRPRVGIADAADSEGA